MKSLSFKPPSKQSGKLLLPAVNLCLFIIGVESGGFQLALLKVAEEFEVNNTLMGAMAAAQFSAIIAMPLLFGGLSDRSGKRIFAMIFAAIFALGSFVAAAAPSMWLFMAGVFILGTGSSVCESTTTAALADAYREKSASYMSFTQCSFSLGAVVGPLFADYAIASMKSGWRALFIICGAAFLLLIPLILRTRFQEVGSEGKTHFSDGSPRILLKAAFICLVIVVMLYVGMEAGTGFFLDTLFTKSLGAPQWSAAAISAFWLATMASRFLCGLLRRHPKSLLAALFGTSAAFLFLLSMTNRFPAALVYCAVLGFLFGPVWPILISFATREFPSNSGLATGVMVASGGFGSTITPIFMGKITDIADAKNAFAALAGFALLAAAISVIYLRKSKNHHIV